MALVPVRDTKFGPAPATTTVVQLTVAALGAVAIAFAAGRLGYAVLPAAATAAAIAFAIVRPRGAAVAVVLLMVAFEPNTPDATSVVSEAIYAFHPRVQDALPLEISPAEVVILVIAGSLALRGPSATDGRRVPWIAWVTVAALVMALGHGLYRGADVGTAYHEARGFIFGCVVFFIAWRLRDTPPQRALRVVTWGSGVLALLLLLRYALITRENFAGTLEAFAHESVIFLAIGISAAAPQILRARSLGSGLRAAGLTLLLVFAIAATGRRSGTLVMLAVGAVTLALLLPKRPILITTLSLLAAVVFAGYLAAFWNSQYGALSQPARAVRSQFDPNERDLSSNQYRDIENFNVTATIRSTPLLGVGFGRPFYEFVPLVQTFGGELWSLQLYTSHNSLLWLWLKLGLGGAAAALTFWMLAMRRCVSHVRLHPPGSTPLLPVIAGATLVAYLVFARVDIVLVSTRAIAPLAIALAVALSLDDGGPALRPDRERLADEAA